MEQVLKILRQLMGTAGVLGSIPKPIKIALTYFGVFVGVIMIFKFTRLGPGEKIFLVIALIVLALITAGYYAWKAWMEREHNRQFGGEISQHSAATPRAVSDPAQRARLDDMRKKFQSGIEAYKSRGKDLYKLPWYVIVGEPGSGKTEAVRHSNVGFPPGMQDEFQGVGGTINMNWWFTNHAVLLDTAGRLMFEEVRPGDTSEWKEFLGLLKKNRPACPINGLFLVIPADSLIKDSADSIQKKAGKIAQQLDVIQRLLDVRFPVFVIVTKCDKINGFREFFDGLTDPQLQSQIMGWSNPSPLDEPFNPELVDKHLEQVAERLRRRRLGLMRDPVPENPEGRRIDEVDSLYALPHSLALLGSRLRRYLETIFVAGEWSAKPSFLRGIYFSSSMREGSALDAELAEAIGVGVEDLPEGKVWERERAYFLRDLFVEKVFREKGLVTRASNTKRMLRNQQVALYGFGFGALALFSILAWFAMRDVRSGVQDQNAYWLAVSKAGWDNKYWKHSIVPLRGDGSFASTISSNKIEVEGKRVSLGEFQAKLRALVEKPMKKRLMFPKMAPWYNENSRMAQRVVFEASVVRPLIEATRQKMWRGENDPGSAQRQPDALAGLIQLENDILSKGGVTNSGEVTQEAARKFLGAFQNYVAGTNLPVDTNLVAVMAWTYSSNETAKGSWAPKWLGGGQEGVNTLSVNRGIDAGMELFVRNATNSIQMHRSNQEQISSLENFASAFYTNEQALFAAAQAGQEGRFVEAQRAVEAARTNLEAQLVKVADHPLFADGLSLTNAQQRFREAVTNSAGAALGRVREVNDAALARHADYRLFREIKTRLDSAQAGLSTQVQALLEKGDLKEFQQLDESCLADSAFAKRANLYAHVEKIMSEPPFAGKIDIGLAPERPEKIKNDIHARRAETVKSMRRLTNEFTRTVEYQIKRAEKAFFSNYVAEVRKFWGEAGFPLLPTNRTMTPDKFAAAGKHLKYISTDLAQPFFKNDVLQDWPEWKSFRNTIETQQAMAKALLDENFNPGKATIYLMTGPQDEWSGSWRDMRLVCGANIGNAVRAQAEPEQKLGDAPVWQKFELLMIKNVNERSPDDEFKIPVPEWGPLWLIHEKKGKPEADLKSWSVELPATAPGARGSIRLKIRFDRPLPALERWTAQ